MTDINAGHPASPLEKPGWTLTFHDEFDRPEVNDLYWYTAYRSGQAEYFRRLGLPNRGGWEDHNAHYLVEDGVLKLRIDRDRPMRPHIGSPAVSCFATSDHRFGADASSYQVLEKFAQKYGWFEMRCVCPAGDGLMSAFWLHQTDPTQQEYTLDGKKREDGVAREIDIFEIYGEHVHADHGKAHLNVHFTPDAHYWVEKPVDFSAGFHVWAMEWREGRVDWHLDGECVGTYEGPTPQLKMFPLMALFHNKFQYDKVESNLDYPKDFEIDYVRVYARE